MNLDLSVARHRAELGALLTGQRILKATVVPDEILISTETRHVSLTMEGPYEDRTLAVTVTGAQADGLAPCKWCNSPTKYQYTRECDRCFELHDKLEGADPEVLRKMAEEMNLLQQRLRED